MDWFERITGFQEITYEQTRAQLRVMDGRISRHGTSESFSVGTLTLPSLAELRSDVARVHQPGRLRLSIVEGDVRAMHRLPENYDALFQVASQFNMLEMVGPEVTPEDGVTGYAYDQTQGPACAMAAGAATIYRNYLVPLADGVGQTKEQQIDGLADIGDALAHRFGLEQAALWTMRNGYVCPTKTGLEAIAKYLRGTTEETLDDLRGRLRVGLHTDVEVTDGPTPRPVVSQIFCSALPVAYSRLSAQTWEPFARLVLEAAYEATLLAGLLLAGHGRSNRVLLTRLGGGAFGNCDEWINDAMLRALECTKDYDLDVSVVSYSQPSVSLRDLVRRYNKAPLASF